ncbi:hypothetical protein DLM45_07495 [Hyphomicrobium methylovorum]|nr:hypothetical protein [Hyphomicrobium methylovorum]MBA2126066.1 hypothetical protein [Hyphomicrobium methylovorum]
MQSWRLFERECGRNLELIWLTRSLKKEAETLRAVEKRMNTTGEPQVSLTHPDARSMATTSKQPRIVGYPNGVPRA